MSTPLVVPIQRKIIVTLRRSVIGRPPNQRATVKALGLGRISSYKEHTCNPAILGMVQTVKHMVSVRWKEGHEPTYKSHQPSVTPTPDSTPVEAS
mmetsp:Transcript_20504/g.35249  ORF Transcript_20504/g.35249 Transcript_20504/m.35249 type:complete len:95 (+) Transcript_20504:39-323(+)